MVFTTAFQVKSLPLPNGLEIHFGKTSAGFFYEIQDVRFLVNVDTKDNLTKEQILEAVDCALGQDQKERFGELVNSL